MNFDDVIDRRGTHSMKWDMMEAAYGVPSDEGIAMWVADMDFPAADPIKAALRDYVEHGIYGYFGDDTAYRAAICWWMQERHGWSVDPSWIFTTHGLVNGTAMCIDSFTKVGDGVIITTPVYHAFARTIKAADRRVHEAELALIDGRYEFDTAAWEGGLKGDETLFILCSPHNPGGRVWRKDELQQIADFCKKHDLILVSDEIHHDLVLGEARHTVMSLVDPNIVDRLVVMTATTKTFNIAGGHSGNVIIQDDALRARFAKRMMAMGISANSFGLHMARAAYSPQGAEWVDAVTAYIAENQRLFNETIDAIPGLRAMPLEATYLAWVDFSGTGMSPNEYRARVEQDAKIAVNHGETFGKGGESYLRFNLATPRAYVETACARLRAAFADLQ